MPASEGAANQAKAMRRARDLRDAADRESAQTVASALVAKTIVITSKAGAEGKLFGSVTTADIAQAIHAQANISIDRKKLHVEPIKTPRHVQRQRQAARRRRVPSLDRGRQGLIQSGRVRLAPVVAVHTRRFG